MDGGEPTKVHERRLLSLWRAVLVLAVAGLVMVLLGAQPLHHKAEALAPSVFRTVALAVTHPLASASGFLHLDWPRERVAYGAASPTTETTAGVGAGEPATSTTSTTNTTSTTSNSPSGTTTTTLTPTPGSTTTTSTVTTTTTTIPVFTKKDPLRVLVVGDSLVDPVGFALLRRVDAYPGLQVKVLARASSGLVRPDFYDWPQVLAKAVADFQPRVTVMLFGGNEKQAMRLDGQLLRPFSGGWNAEYALRVKHAVEITATAGGNVVWIGLPIMRSGKFSETARTLNTFYMAACADHEGAVYIDGYGLFSDPEGKYSPYLKDSLGKNRLMRAGDGIHFTDAGGDRAAEAVMQVLLGRYRLE